MAAFSAGRPKESQPMGCITLYPRCTQYRAMTSPSAYASAWPMCRSPDGYGNMSSTYSLRAVVVRPAGAERGELVPDRQPLLLQRCRVVGRRRGRQGVRAPRASGSRSRSSSSRGVSSVGVLVRTAKDPRTGGVAAPAPAARTSGSGVSAAVEEEGSAAREQPTPPGQVISRWIGRRRRRRRPATRISQRPSSPPPAMRSREGCAAARTEEMT